MDVSRTLPPERGVVSIYSPDDEETLERLLGYLERTRPTMAEVRQAVCEYYLIEPTDMTSLTRHRFIVIARWMFGYLAFRYTRHSMAQIAPKAGYADHSSISYGIQQIEQMLQTRALMRDDYDLLRLRIVEKVVLRRTGFAHAEAS